MVTADQIYWVMQMDTIILGLVLLGLLLFFGGMMFAFGYGEEGYTGSAVFCAFLSFMGFLMLVSTMFLPSTKTSAAMIVLPAITNDKVVDTVAPEARELYELAKDALKNMGAKDAKKEPAEEK